MILEKFNFEDQVQKIKSIINKYNFIPNKEILIISNIFFKTKLDLIPIEKKLNLHYLNSNQKKSIDLDKKIINKKFHIIIFFHTIDEFENRVDAINFISKRLHIGGKLIIFGIEEDLPRYAAKHFIDRNKVDISLEKYFEKKFIKLLAKISFYVHFRIQPPKKVFLMFKFIENLLSFNKFNFKKFLNSKDYISFFLQNGFRVDHYKGLTGEIYLHKYH